MGAKVVRKKSHKWIHTPRGLQKPLAPLSGWDVGYPVSLTEALDGRNLTYGKPVYWPIDGELELDECCQDACLFNNGGGCCEHLEYRIAKRRGYVLLLEGSSSKEFLVGILARLHVG